MREVSALAEKEKHGRIYRFSEKIFDIMLSGYSRTLKVVLRHQPLTLLITIATAALSVYLYIIVPKGFFPQQDTGRVMGSVQAAQDISFAAMKEKMTQFVNIVMKDPAVETMVGFAGGNTSANQGRMFITLKPLAERKISADQVIGRLRRKLSRSPGRHPVHAIRAGPDHRRPPEPGAISIHACRAKIWMTSITGRRCCWINCANCPELRDVNTDQQDKGLEATVIIDRDTASRLGVDAADDRQRSLRRIWPAPGFHHVQAAEPISRGHGSSPRFPTAPEALQNIYVRATNGTAVPLSSFAHFEPSNTPLAVSHQGQFPAGDHSFNLAPGRLFGPGH